jgi:S1-C subfamily serine protease
MNRLIPLLLLAVAIPACQRSNPPIPKPEVSADTGSDLDATRSTVRITSTRQSWNQRQPWEKNSPRKRSSLGVVVAGPRVLTTAEMVTDATYVELETTDGLQLAPAVIDVVDYEANLALLKLQDESDPFFENLTPVALAETPAPGSELEIVQVENNGLPLITRGPIQGVDIISPFLPSYPFLTFEVKASMQNSASSFSLPVFHQGRLAGILTNYDSDDQLSRVTATPILRQFMTDAADGEYRGFPSLGIATTSTDDARFREWLKLPADAGGLYISMVRDDSPATAAGVQAGDVLLALDDYEIDRLGYYEDPTFGRIFWTHLVRGAKGSGETLGLKILRDGETLEVEAKLERMDVSDSLVPTYTYGQAPNFLIKGGMLFQELTEPMLRSFGKEWSSRAPLDLLNAYENPEDYEDRFDRVVFLSGVIPTPATVGYESLNNLILSQVNGEPVCDMASLIQAFEKKPENGLHSIEFDNEDVTVYLDEALSSQVDAQLIQRGLTRLSRAD